MIIDKTGKKYKTPNKKYNSVNNSIEDFKKMYGLETEENKLENYKQTSPTTPTAPASPTAQVRCGRGETADRRRRDSLDARPPGPVSGFCC